MAATGSRDAFAHDFLSALHDDFQRKGKSAIVMARRYDPVAYLRVCAALLPKELNIRHERDMSDDELDGRIRELVTALGDELGLAVKGAEATGGAAGGEASQVRH